VRGTHHSQGARNCFQDAIHILEHFIVPKSQHAISMLSQPTVTFHVTFVERVLSAIEFNNQSLLAADKVDDIPADRLLSDELAASELARP
jgi:hypothetical protein